MKNFALVGCGYIAKKHLEAIKETGNNLLYACDIRDSVGFLDQYFPKAKFFLNFEKFIYFLEMNKPELDYIVICTPNYLHNYHIQESLIYADVICEKPLVLYDRDLEYLLYENYKNHIYPIVQLRLHEKIQEIKNQLKGNHEVKIEYYTPRGDWYNSSWKSYDWMSGGFLINFGVHLFDLCCYLFGNFSRSDIIMKSNYAASGVFYFDKAVIFWYLKTSDTFLKSKRIITIDGKEINLTKGIDKLHIESYKKILQGEGFAVEDVAPSIKIVNRLKEITVV